MLDVCLCLWKRDVTLLKTTLLHSAFFPCKDVLRARVLKWNWAQIKLCATERLLIICGTFSWQPRRDFWDTHMRPGGAYFQPTLVPQGTVAFHYPSSPRLHCTFQVLWWVLPKSGPPYLSWQSWLVIPAVKTVWRLQHLKGVLVLFLGKRNLGGTFPRWGEPTGRHFLGKGNQGGSLEWTGLADLFNLAFNWKRDMLIKSEQTDSKMRDWICFVLKKRGTCSFQPQVVLRWLRTWCKCLRTISMTCGSPIGNSVTIIHFK